MIIDAHVHLPVFEELHTLAEKRRRLLADLRRDGVDACVVISDSTLESTIGSMTECVDLFAADENVAVIGGISPLIDFSLQLERLRGYLLSGAVAGIKLFPGHEGFPLSDPRLGPVYRLAEELDAPVLFHSGWDNSHLANAQEIRTVLAAWPKVKLVCCHCLYPEIRQCFPLTEFPQLIFDLSSVADDPRVTEEIREDVRSLILQAPDRVVFGSDYASCERPPHLALIRRLELPREVEEKVFCENARALYFRR